MIDEIDRLYRIILNDIPKDNEIAEISFINGTKETQGITLDYTKAIEPEQLHKLYTLISECYNSRGYMLIGTGKDNSMEWLCKMFQADEPAGKYIYNYWHHNSIGADEQKDITDMIMAHCYDAFMQVYATYQLCPINNANGICYFPDVITVVEDDSIRFVSVFEKENFNKITDVKVTCG